jgi:hypothetical protein
LRSAADRRRIDANGAALRRTPSHQRPRQKSKIASRGRPARGEEGMAVNAFLNSGHPTLSNCGADETIGVIAARSA